VISSKIIVQRGCDYFLQLLEYKRILAYAVAPTVAFITVGLLLPTDSAPPYVCPMVYLGLLTILSCFVFDSEGPDGFFVQPASSWERGIRFFGVKVLELVGDKVAFSICGDGVTGRRAPFLDMNFGETVLYVTALTIMSVSFLRSGEHRSNVGISAKIKLLT